eukprot:4627200-Pyramimonas_sp.AAC.1
MDGWIGLAAGSAMVGLSAVCTGSDGANVVLYGAHFQISQMRFVDQGRKGASEVFRETVETSVPPRPVPTPPSL